MNIRIALIFLVFGFTTMTIAAISRLQLGGSSMILPSLFQEVASSPGLIWLHLSWFLISFIALHLGFAFAICFATKPAILQIEKNKTHGSKILFAIALFSILLLTLENAARFQHSQLAHSLTDFSLSNVGVSVRIFLAIIIGGFIFSGFYIRVARILAQLRNGRSYVIYFSVAVLLALAYWLHRENHSTVPFPINLEHPHIVIIGIDGWRYDMLPDSSGSNIQMPFVYSLLQDSVRFESAMTPIGRTYPAWASIMNGQYPINNGTRFNFMPREIPQTGHLLPKQLSEIGYHTIFALDERLGANIDESYGFDQIVGPAMGAADFLLCRINDSPLTNLFSNSILAKYLFPFTYSNRAAHVTYRPSTFDGLLESSIRKAPRNPLFLISHYEMAHWPFKWADGPAIDHHNLHPYGNGFTGYLQTLAVVDKQIENLFSVLSELGILDNAIVILLSDHGEEFTNENKIWTWQHNGRQLRTPPGHGTHVFGIAQHKVPLAIRAYGFDSLTPRTIQGWVSLTDISPTLTDWLSLDIEHKTDGESLYPLIKSDRTQAKDRAIPFETGFYVGALSMDQLNELSLFDQSINYYKITADGRLELRMDELPDLIRDKQRAIIKNDTILAAIQVPSQSDQVEFVKANIDNHTLRLIDLEGTLEEEDMVLIQSFCDLYANDAADHLCH